MRIFEIEKKFESKETLEEVLKELSDDFEQIDNYANDIKENLLGNPEAIMEALNVLTGIYMHLRPVLGIADVKSEILPERRNFEILKDLEENGLQDSDGKKISSLTYFQERAKRESRGECLEYSKVRNIIHGYTISCEKSISVLQSQLGYLKKEYIQQQTV